jgi:ATP-dependent Clp protease ATP-binding subunit ClpX
MESILLDTMFDLPGMQGVDEIVVDKDVVGGSKEPIRIFAHQKESAGDAA